MQEEKIVGSRQIVTVQQRLFLSKSDSNLSEETYASSLLSDSDTESEQNYTRENGINIYYTNADSLIKKKDELDIVIQERNPDMIVITEVYPKTSKSTDISESELVIKGYAMIQSETRKKKPWCLHIL